MLWELTTVIFLIIIISRQNFLTHKLGIIIVLNIETELFFSFFCIKNKNYITLWRPNKRVYKYLNIFIINESRVAYDNFIHPVPGLFHFLYLNNKKNQTKIRFWILNKIRSYLLALLWWTFWKQQNNNFIFRLNKTAIRIFFCLNYWLKSFHCINAKGDGFKWYIFLMK